MMKKLVVILLILMVSPGVWAQQESESSALSKKEKRQLELEKQFQQTQALLDSRDFVLEADFLQDRYGNRVFVSSIINFIAIDSTEAVIQIGSNHSFGPNGLGGVTAKGKITNWELKTNEKNKSFRLTVNVMTNIGLYDVNFSISASGRATALLTGLRRGNLSFEGNLIPLQESYVFEGNSI